MKIKYYEIDEKKLLKEAKKGKKIGIKLPEGFFPYASKILNFLEEKGINVFLLEPCYGACDFLEEDFKRCDRIIFIGEAKMPYLKYKLSFIEAKYDFDIKQLKRTFEYNGKKVGLVSITPFVHKIWECKKFLEENGYKVFIGKKSRRTAYDGQILGCDFSSAMQISSQINNFLYIGDGFFHPVGLYIATKKDVVVFNPIEKRVYKVEEIANRIIKKRYAMIAKAMEAKKFGIIVCIKLGQRRIRLAKKMKKLVENAGKKAHLIFLNNIDEKLNYFDFDCYISTACPRVAIDDAEKYKKPILTPIEAQILFNERKSYEFDQIL